MASASPAPVQVSLRPPRSERIGDVWHALRKNPTAIIGLVLLLPMILTGRVVPWHSKRLAGHFWRTFMGTVSMVLGF